MCVRRTEGGRVRERERVNEARVIGERERRRKEQHCSQLLKAVPSIEEY